MKMERRNFSLIELLIVIGIMGALAALILPAFSDSESAAKDTACDYNQAGTLRYLNLFYGANGVYPTGFHTGGSSLTWGAGESGGTVELTPCGTHNFTKASNDQKVGGQPLPTDQSAGNSAEANGKQNAMTASLQAAGIVTLAYGQADYAGVANLSTDTITVKTVKPGDTSWTEELDPVTGEVNANGAPLAFRGVALGKIAELGAETSIDMGTTENKPYIQFRGANEKSFKIVPFYVAPTIDWEHYYSDGPNDSKIKIALPGKCPWGEGGQARYYIAFFKVYTETEDNGDAIPAKLLCTSCPDCGILESDAF